MKKVFCILITILFLFTLCVEAFAVKIDGNIERAEWLMEAVDFIKSSSGCNINSFIYQYSIDEKNDRLNFAFRTTEKSVIENFSNCAFEVIIDDEFSIIVSPDEDKFDSEYFDVDSAMNLSGQQIVSCEMSILFKKGIDKSLSLTISAYDSFGDSSRDYNLEISSDENEEGEDNSTQSKTTKEKTTKAKKQKTTKAKTSKYVTVKSNKKSKTIENADNEYETVDEEEYVEEAYEEVDVEVQDNEENQDNTGAIVLKTLAATIALVSLGAILFTVKKNRNN